MADESIVVRPLVVIVGPTASGKTGLALSIAEKYKGEIIAADSRTIYTGLDIGTAKPSIEERTRVPHHGFDLIDPDEIFSAVQFQRYAKRTINDIRARGAVPFLVGGTGLYINAVIYNYKFANMNADLRNELDTKGVNELYIYCSNNNILLPPKGMSKPHLINYIVRNGSQKQSYKPFEKDVIVVGITTDKALLKKQIHHRATAMFDEAIIAEAQLAADRHGWSAPGLSGNIYKIVREFLSGDLAWEEAIKLSEIRDWQLAKRQMTWFRRDPNIKWLQIDEAEHYIASILDT